MAHNSYNEDNNIVELYSFKDIDLFGPYFATIKVIEDLHQSICVKDYSQMPRVYSIDVKSLLIGISS